MPVYVLLVPYTPRHIYWRPFHHLLVPKSYMCISIHNACTKTQHFIAVYNNKYVNEHKETTLLIKLLLV